jgi:hypothetical protein
MKESHKKTDSEEFQDFIMSIDKTVESLEKTEPPFSHFSESELLCIYIINYL